MLVWVGASGTHEVVEKMKIQILKFEYLYIHVAKKLPALFMLNQYSHAPVQRSRHAPHARTYNFASKASVAAVFVAVCRSSKVPVEYATAQEKNPPNKIRRKHRRIGLIQRVSKRMEDAEFEPHIARKHSPTKGSDAREVSLFFTD